MRYLADKSALARGTRPEVREILEPMLSRGLLGLCAVTELELGHSTTSGPGRLRQIEGYRRMMPRVNAPDGVWDTAMEMQDRLAERGQHRGIGVADLLIAATAKLLGMTVLHYDRDFELIAQATGLKATWVVPAGSVD